MNGRQNRPVVSIVTPSYNQGRFLEETLLSVQRQDYPWIEHIVVDGGSTDGSLDVIRRHEKHLARWASERDHGQSDAIRKGFALATGEVFAWLNADDLLIPSAVSVAVRELTRDPALSVVYGDRLEIDAKGNVLAAVQLPAHRNAMFRRHFSIPQETAFFRRAHYEAVGGVRAELQFAMDFDLWVRLSTAGPMRHVPLFLGCYRRHDRSKSVKLDAGSAEHPYRAESEDIYQQHFGRGLPSRRAMAVYRLAHRARLTLEQLSAARRQQRARLQRELAEGW